MGKKLTNLNRYISVITDIDEKGFAVFEHIINLLSFGYICLSQFENYFFVLFLFSYFFPFCFSSRAVRFKTAKRNVFKV